MNKTETRDE